MQPSRRTPTHHLPPRKRQQRPGQAGHLAGSQPSCRFAQGQLLAPDDPTAVVPPAACLCHPSSPSCSPSLQAETQPAPGSHLCHHHCSHGESVSSGKKQQRRFAPCSAKQAPCSLESCSRSSAQSRGNEVEKRSMEMALTASKGGN